MTVPFEQLKICELSPELVTPRLPIVKPASRVKTLERALASKRIPSGSKGETSTGEVLPTLENIALVLPLGTPAVQLAPLFKSEVPPNQEVEAPSRRGDDVGRRKTVQSDMRIFF